MFKIKKSASIRGLRPEMVIAAQVVSSVCRVFGVDCVITSGTDGEHSEGSIHYSGGALDFRTRDLDEADRPVFAVTAARDLGDDFDVVLEKTHLHVEFQPKTPLNT